MYRPPAFTSRQSAKPFAALGKPQPARKPQQPAEPVVAPKPSTTKSIADAPRGTGSSKAASAASVKPVKPAKLATPATPTKPAKPTTAVSTTPKGKGRTGAAKDAQQSGDKAADREALVAARQEEIRGIIADALGLAPEFLRAPASQLRLLASHSRPTNVAAKLLVLLKAFEDQPAERALLERAIRVNPMAVLANNAGTVLRKYGELQKVFGFTPAAKGGKAAAAASQVAVMEVVARDPRLLQHRPDSLEAKIEELVTMLGKDRDFVLQMVRAKPRLLAGLSNARIAAKLRVLRAAAARVPRWEAELEDAAPAQLGGYLAVGLDVVARLTFLADNNLARLPIRTVVKTTAERFQLRHPRFPMWLEANRPVVL